MTNLTALMSGQSSEVAFCWVSLGCFNDVCEDDGDDAKGVKIETRETNMIFIHI
jgi:hypothetical protein